MDKDSIMKAAKAAGLDISGDKIAQIEALAADGAAEVPGDDKRFKVVAAEQGHTWSLLVVGFTNQIRSKVLAVVDASIDALAAKGVNPPTA